MACFLLQITQLKLSERVATRHDDGFGREQREHSIESSTQAMHMFAENSLCFGEECSLAAIVSQFLGWMYFLAWSLSFYPQVIMNMQRKSVEGLSLDFLNLNAFGFLCYTVYNTLFYFNGEIRREYRQRNDGKDNLIRLNDVVFATHALLITLVTIVQSRIYKSTNSQSSISLPTLLFIAVALFAATVYAITIAFDLNDLMWIDLVYFIGTIKLVISFLKYVPQAYLNHVRKSTDGWSIGNILLDFTGGTLSLVQLVIDAVRLGDIGGGIRGVAVKLLLGLVSMSFDIIFMIQHYILYGNNIQEEYEGIAPGRDSHPGSLEEQESLFRAASSEETLLLQDDIGDKSRKTGQL